jgi:acetyl esterase
MSEFQSFYADTAVSLPASVQRYLAHRNSAGAVNLCDMDIQVARQRFDYWGPLSNIVPRALASVKEVTIDARDGTQLSARIYYPTSPCWTTPLPALLYFHSGGYVFGGLNTADALCRTVAADAGCAVVSVSYRLAPEHKFPRAVHDAIDALYWLHDEADHFAIDPRRLAVGGESSGATLAAVCAMKARDAGIPLALQLLIYPTLSAAMDTEAHRCYGQGYYLSLDLMRWIRQQYLKEADDCNDWRFAPLDGTQNAPKDWRNLAPAWIASAECDPVRDENISYAEKLIAHGNTATLRIYRGMIHGFFSMGRLIPEALAAHRETADALRAALASD